MKQVLILDNSDTIQESDYFRPLLILYSDLGEIHFTGTYGGRPINHFKWLPVKGDLDPSWFGKRVDEFNAPGHTPYEFLRGTPPAGHILRV